MVTPSVIIRYASIYQNFDWTVIYIVSILYLYYLYIKLDLFHIYIISIYIIYHIYISFYIYMTSTMYMQCVVDTVYIYIHDIYIQSSWIEHAILTVARIKKEDPNFPFRNLRELQVHQRPSAFTRSAGETKDAAPVPGGPLLAMGSSERLNRSADSAALFCIAVSAASGCQVNLSLHIIPVRGSFKTNFFVA